MRYGIGYNSGGEHKTQIDGKEQKVFSVWKHMIQRCYSEKFHLKYPTYAECFVCVEWHDFQNFADWYSENYINGFDLDKDLLVKDNKCYGPEFCEFIPHQINTLLLDSGKSRGDLPMGIYYSKKDKTYVARCKIGVKNKKEHYIGINKDPQIAFQMYKDFKEAHIKNIANEYKDQISEAIYNNLMNYTIEEKNNDK